jgi:hypothetical protein
MPYMLHFINMIIKSTLERDKFKQIGRLPKFFLETEKKEIKEYGIEVWPGYLTTTKMCHDGIYLNIDTCTKFMSTSTVLKQIENLLKSKMSP